MNMGHRIKEVRLERKVSQPELAAKTGISQQNLSSLEMRDSKTSEWAPQIADALGVSLRWLLTGNGRPTDNDHWPFPRVTRDRWDACTDEDRGYVQAAINKALDECEAIRGATAASEPAPRKPPPRLAA